MFMFILKVDLFVFLTVGLNEGRSCQIVTDVD